MYLKYYIHLLSDPDSYHFALIAQLLLQLVRKYNWHRTVCGQGLVLLSTLRSLSDCVDFDADLRLLSHQVCTNIVVHIT